MLYLTQCSMSAVDRDTAVLHLCYNCDSSVSTRATTLTQQKSSVRHGKVSLKCSIGEGGGGGGGS